MMTPLLLTGAQGQLGSTVAQHWDGSALSERFSLVAIDVQDLDLTQDSAVSDYLNQLKPKVIINAAAYTAVDAAESQPERAYAVNEQAVANLASWSASNKVSLVQISTDFVFNGEASSPYNETAETGPLSVYGASKLAGEQQLVPLLSESASIVRTSWLYSEYGGNFVKTMLRLMQERSEQGKPLGVVADQFGSPTSSHSLVKFLFALLASGSARGIYHWSDGAAISWYDFAVAIQEAGLEAGLLRTEIELERLGTADYPTPATRPAYSVLDRSKALSVLGEQASSWQKELQQVVSTLARNQKTDAR